MNSIRNLQQIDFFIPAMPKTGARKNHHVISIGQRPKFYREEELRDKGSGNTDWVGAFEEIFMGLYWALGAPVPYAFRTPDGKVRSLDAGCMKMLLNRKEQELKVIADREGFIDFLEPNPILIKRYESRKEELVDWIRSAPPSTKP